MREIRSMDSVYLLCLPGHALRFQPHSVWQDTRFISQWEKAHFLMGLMSIGLTRAVYIIMHECISSYLCDCSWESLNQSVWWCVVDYPCDNRRSAFDEGIQVNQSGGQRRASDGLPFSMLRFFCAIFSQNFIVRCCHIYHCSMCFCRQNTVISIGIHMILNFVWMLKIFPCRFHNGFSGHTDSAHWPTESCLYLKGLPVWAVLHTSLRYWQ